MSDLADYIADHYGACTMPVCRCLKEGWTARRCPSWLPVKATNWAELQDAQIVFAREARRGEAA